MHEPLPNSDSMAGDIAPSAADPNDDTAIVSEPSTATIIPVTCVWSSEEASDLFATESVRPVSPGPMSRNQEPEALDKDEGSCDFDIVKLFSSQSLPTDIDADILRGVNIKIVLEGFGKAFSGSTGAQSEFMKSAPKTRLDDFISHDWASERFGKLAALCILYNSTAALAISSVVGVALVALQSKSLVGVLPYPERERNHEFGGWGCWCQCMCPVVFVYILIYWQTIRMKLGLPTKQVFLDKLCVDQINPQKKVKAILGLAGFLKNTNRLVICWTQPYFTRLWCVYEIASWLHLQKPLDDITFIPVSLAKAVFALFSTFVLSINAVAVGQSIAMGQYANGLSEAVVIAVIFLFGPWYTHTLRHMVHDLRNLPCQLETFSAATAKCYCCAVNHKIPGTGQVLQCDRRVVCRTVKEWFPKDFDKELPPDSAPARVSGSTQGSVDTVTQFDHKVHDLFGPFILQRTGPTQIHYKYCVFTGIPCLWRLLDVMVSYGTWDVSLQVKLSKVLEYFVITFCIIPSGAKASLWYLLWFDKKYGRCDKPVLDWLLSIAVFLPQGIFFTACIVPFAEALDERNWCLFYGISVTCMITTAFLFLPFRSFGGSKSAQVDGSVS